MTCRPGFSRALRAILALLAILTGSTFFACGEAENEAAEVDSAAIQVSGRYEMSGVTTTPGTDQKRKIHGTIVLEEVGGKYKAGYQFKTNFPGEGPPVDADVIGVGEGGVLNRQLSGTARTQIVVSAVPGVDTGFAYIPRLVSTRIVSQVTGEFGAEGALVIEIESQADEGEDYQSTRTRMRGKRVGGVDSSPLDSAKAETRKSEQ